MITTRLAPLLLALSGCATPGMQVLLASSGGLVDVAHRAALHGCSEDSKGVDYVRFVCPAGPYNPPAGYPPAFQDVTVRASVLALRGASGVVLSVPLLEAGLPHYQQDLVVPIGGRAPASILLRRIDGRTDWQRCMADQCATNARVILAELGAGETAPPHPLEEQRVDPAD